MQNSIQMTRMPLRGVGRGSFEEIANFGGRVIIAQERASSRDRRSMPGICNSYCAYYASRFSLSLLFSLKKHFVGGLLKRAPNANFLWFAEYANYLLNASDITTEIPTQKAGGADVFR